MIAATQGGPYVMSGHIKNMAIFRVSYVAIIMNYLSVIKVLIKNG
jgi:hypothetical protein